MDLVALCNDINAIATFLSCEDVPDLACAGPIDCLVLCASQLIIQAERVFDILLANPSLAKCLVLVGGKGHSTELLYEAISRHPRYCSIAEKVQGLPEARVLETMLDTFFGRNRIVENGCQILVEDRSTNCGANATETRKLLESSELRDVESFVIVQDPTMLLRTVKSFEKAYEATKFSTGQPKFLGCPLFAPQMKSTESGPELSMSGIETWQLWKTDRFYELLVGEIPRLKDDAQGYGPQGKGFITHVDVPLNIELAAENLQRLSGVTR